MKVLLDHDLPKQLRLHITGHLVLTARQMRWDALQNGHLIVAAEIAGFEVLVTSDQKMFYQQNNTKRRIGIVMLTNPLLKNVLPVINNVMAAVNKSFAGSYSVVEIPLPPKRPRPVPSV